MKTKYYQLRERAEDFASIGVIKSVDGEFDTDQIKTALQSHFDDEVEDLYVNSEQYDITIRFKLKGRDVDPDEEVDGEVTWLYI